MGNWRSAGSDECAWFGAGSHEQGALLAAAIVDGPTSLPDLDVRADGVRVRVTGGRPTAAIDAAARALGLVPDPAVLQEVRYQVDGDVAGFWRTALNYGDVGTGLIGDGLRRCPVVRFGEPGEARPLRNRIHVDSGHPGPVPDVVAALKAEGGRVAFECEWYSTMADADGNEIDVVPGGALAAGSDWNAMFGAMAHYPGTSPRQAADIALAAARLADEAAIPLMIDLRPEGVVFDSGKDQWELVAGFSDLASAVQDAARAAGLVADNSRLRFVQAVIDAADIPAVREFWRVVLGYVPAPDAGITDLFDPRQLNPVLLFSAIDTTETERRRQRNRIHVELLLPADHLRARVDVAVAAGGRVLEEQPGRYRLADPEGNELVLSS
jgi:Glyoxalase-like domain